VQKIDVEVDPFFSNVMILVNLLWKAVLILPISVILQLGKPKV